MELDELKSAWRSLGEQLERQQDIQWQLLRDSRLGRVRGQLRPLLWGQALQLLLGVGLIALGVACWTRNTDAPALLASGLLVHAFGLVTAVMAALTIAFAATIDYSAPVLVIQRRMARLLRLFVINANACGWPWWIMWVLVVVAFAGLGEVDPAAGTPGWIAISLAVGVAGLLGTWGWSAWSSRRRRGSPPGAHDDGRCVADGGDGIRRAQRLLDEIAQFERG
ncbi:serine/threonine protein kinase [Luteimonas kalidii]|uniref:Serine/threonine protein kinase n=1 Tax=Luteimonas kalidii TaxID=3042025 RepID=A0ABT6JPH5_9GAMM|nr:serine/threonine protein kinase [Luteimonas kalidii]MDH5832580.1 serine/threonine protein kinase [Luteimonas kalidii]